MDKTINIAIALNQRVIIQTYVMIHSLVVNNTAHPLCIYVLHSELTEDQCRLLEKAADCPNGHSEMRFIKIAPDKTSGLPYNGWWSVEAYYRLMLPELLGNQIERILYLDIDVIVNKDISDFYFSDFEGNALIATKDAEFENAIALDEPQDRKRNAFFLNLKNQGMVYFCSGVLLMNLEVLKANYTFDKYLEIFDTIKDNVLLPDQDLLNYVHYKEVKLVDENKYGLFTQTAHKNGMTYEEAKKNVSILHFTGKAKPWTVNLIRYDIEKIWWEYAKAAPFYYDLLEQVFFDMLESTFTERKFDELVAQNNELRGMLQSCQNLIQKLQL